ncbi:MAG: hypothetical protein ACLQIQ_00270 [Beijerinckiaceae bacterium]
MTNLVIQIICGIFGGHAAAITIIDHNFGGVGHTIAGAIGGAISGSFFQTLVGTMVTASGSVNTSSPAKQAVLQGLAGAVVGGIAVLVGGIIKHGIDQHKTPSH